MRVAVVGAGPSGLTAIKCCLDENIEPFCFEQEDEIGGAWRFKEDPSKNSVYRSTVINTSKEMSCYSDFPHPKDFPPFFTQRHMIKYYELYSRHFNLSRFIRFGHQVVDICRTADHAVTGRWLVSYKNLRTGEDAKIEREVYDAVMLCSGHLWLPLWPSFPGMNKFSGKILHSANYRDFRGFEEKTVLVIGLGNSAADIAVELSRHASQVYVSTRRGAWIRTRVSSGGLPMDYWSTCRFIKAWPVFLQKWIYVKKTYKLDINYDNLGLTPVTGYYGGAAVINDELPSRISTGTLLMKPDVDHLTPTGVAFVDGTVVENVDAVICCTGYNIEMKYVDSSILSIDDNVMACYKFIFPPDHLRHTMACIGYVQVNGSMNPVFELQARFAVRVFKRLIKLPSKEVMKREIRLSNGEIERQMGYKSKRLHNWVDGLLYPDELAQQIGCKPGLLKLFFQDPLLACRCFFGPCVPAQYRLCGPGKWPGAKKVIEEAYENVIYPTKTRVVPSTPTECGLGKNVIKLALLAVVSMCAYKVASSPSLTHFFATVSKAL